MFLCDMGIPLLKVTIAQFNVIVEMSLSKNQIISHKLNDLHINYI
jgi:hypothetical protein